MFRVGIKLYMYLFGFWGTIYTLYLYGLLTNKFRFCNLERLSLVFSLWLPRQQHVFFTSHAQWNSLAIFALWRDPLGMPRGQKVTHHFGNSLWNRYFKLSKRIWNASFIPGHNKKVFHMVVQCSQMLANIKHSITVFNDHLFDVCKDSFKVEKHLCLAG